MTLVELVIGIAITAMMAAAGAAAFNTIIERRETISRASTATERAAALRETIRQWIVEGTLNVQRGSGPRGLSSAAGRGSAGTLGRLMSSSPFGTSAAAAGVTAATSTGQELTVTTTAPNPLMAPQVRLRLFVDADGATPERGLTIEYQSITANTPLRRRQLDSLVGDIRVEFLDQRTRLWYESTQAAAITPIAVRVTLLPLENDTLPRLLTLPIVVRSGEPQ
jgi:hypothetical protein